MKTTKLIITGASLFLAAAFAAHAQNESTSQYRSDSQEALRGDWEFTLGGSGSSNKDIDNSLGGVNFSVGYFVTDTFEIAVRQSATYVNGPAGGAQYDGSTFIVLDEHFGTGRLRPFVGLSFGGLYGDTTSDTFAAGVEGGLKFFVKPKTFLYALVNYEWTFNNSGDVTDRFSDGGFLWATGIGFNF